MGALLYSPLNDLGFLGDAEHVAKHSKDPSTQVGAVVVRPDRTVASSGFNGFPRGVKDLPERYENRDVKYKLVVHAEQNAIVTAREPLHGYTMYSTLSPCHECAKLIIQAGIKRVVAPRPSDEEAQRRGERWQDSHSWAAMLFAEAGVELVLIDV